MTTAAQNAEKVDWGEEVPKPREGTGTPGEERVNQEWMKFPKPGKYQVRLVGTAVKYLKHGEPPFKFPKRLITHGNFKGEDPAWNAKFYPSVNYAQFMIDRSDKKVKILDRSKKFFEPIRDFKVNNDIDPGASNSVDFVITVTWPIDPETGKPNKRRATYSVSPLMERTPFTEDEVAEIKRVCAKQKRKVVDEDTGEEKEVKISPLEIIYRSNTLEEIKAAWNELPEEDKIKKERIENSVGKEAVAKENTSSMKSEVEETPEPVAAGDDDLFGDDETGF